MKIQTWVTTVINAPSNARQKIKRAVLEGMTYFGGVWESKGSKKQIPENGEQSIEDILTGPIKYKLKSKNKDVQEIVDELSSEKNFSIVGFVPEITYMKVKGPKDHLECMWEHQFGSPTLLYAHKSLPILIIAGPDIMFNDSMVKSIKANNYKDSVYGITG